MMPDETQDPADKQIGVQPLVGRPDHLSLDRIVEVLEDAAYLEGSELGEYWEGLTALRSRVTDCASDEFAKAYDIELRHQHRYLTSNFEIVKQTEDRSHSFRELREKGVS